MSPTSPACCPSRAERPPRRRRALLLATLGLGLLGCSASPPHYETRGVVTARTGSGAATRYAIHHEPLPAFRDREGDPAPMGSMTMMFGLGPDVRALDLAPGTKVALAFDVHWSGGETLRITRIGRLPEHTRLALSEHAPRTQRDGGRQADP